MRWSLLGAFAIPGCVYALDDSWNATVTALSSYCAAQQASFTKTYRSTQIATSRWTWYEGIGPTDSRGILTGSVTSQSYWTSTFLYTEYAIQAYTPKPPCCSSCYMTAGTIDFYFWPDQATPTAPTTGQPTTSVNAEGFTFTSPSVYMAFSSLAANNRCGPVGDVWTNTTIGFHPTEITTARPITTLSVISSPTVDGGTTYNYIISAITTRPPPRQIDYNDIGQNCSTIAGYVYWPDNPINADNANYKNDPCHPIIELPERLLTMQPAWAEASCGMPPGTSGAYDPPRVLTPLVAATQVAVPTPNWEKTTATQTASPASSIEGGATSTALPVTTGVSAAYDVVGDTSATETAAAAKGAGSQGNEAGSTQQAQSDQTEQQQAQSQQTQQQQQQQQQATAVDSGTEASSANAESSVQTTGMGAVILSGLGSSEDGTVNTAGPSAAQTSAGSGGSPAESATAQITSESQGSGSAVTRSASKAATRSGSATQSASNSGSDGASTATTGATAPSTAQSSGIGKDAGLRMELLLMAIGLFGILVL